MPVTSSFVLPPDRLPGLLLFCCLLVLSGRESIAAPARPLDSLNLSAAIMPGFSPEPLRPLQPQREASRTIDSLFSEDIQQVPSRLKWRGEALSPDTLYAAALTGLAWEQAWGREHLFSLAWGEARKGSHAKPRSSSEAALREEVQSCVERRDWRRVVSVASASRSLDEIAGDPVLKEAVGQSFLALRQPERAFPLFAAPFEAEKGRTDSADINRRCREGAFEAAQQAGLKKEAVTFALSLLLEPGTRAGSVNTSALRYLEGAGVDVDRVLLGILQSPERLRGLPGYAYAAADLLAMRATPRQLPFLLHLASTDDTYLRARALLGLGVVAYRARRTDPPGWAGRVLLAPLREYGISTGQRRMISDEAQKAARSDNYRLRAAACLALGLMGDESDVPLLQKLSADHAYTLSPEPGDRAGRDKTRRLAFPVRMAAALALTRYGFTVEAAPLDLAGKDLDRARRGGQDVTGDRRNLRRDVWSLIVVSPLDTVLSPSLEIPKHG